MLQIARIDEHEMRNRFNAGGYWERVKAGTLRAVVLQDRHPSLPAANEPFCTKSQMVSYRESSGDEVARVHQYLRPDGTLGASGRPDPKRLCEAGILYRLHRRGK
jgi:hypothetical protein